MIKLRGIVLAGMALSLAACSGVSSHSEVQALNEVQPVGSPFTQSLAAEYRDFANREMHEMFDYPDAIHFARKGLASAGGDAVMPEPISDWNLLPRHMEELSTARGRLITAFDRGARDIAPKLSAVSQARFDCWIEQQEENWQDDDISVCKSQFMEAMAQLEALLPEPAPMPAEDVMAPVSALDMDAAAPMAVADAMYLVFFDFDSSAVNDGGHSVLDAVAAEISSRNIDMISVVGHTDSSGSDAYNDKLAMRRGNAVRDALVNRGIDPAKISVEGRGERELLVQTADGVREPANRRGQISFR